MARIPQKRKQVVDSDEESVATQRYPCDAIDGRVARRQTKSRTRGQGVRSRESDNDGEASLPLRPRKTAAREADEDYEVDDVRHLDGTGTGREGTNEGNGIHSSDATKSSSRLIGSHINTSKKRKTSGGTDIQALLSQQASRPIPKRHQTRHDPVPEHPPRQDRPGRSQGLHQMLRKNESRHKSALSGGGGQAGQAGNARPTDPSMQADDLSSDPISDDDQDVRNHLVKNHDTKNHTIKNGDIKNGDNKNGDTKNHGENGRRNVLGDDRKDVGVDHPPPRLDVERHPDYDKVDDLGLDDDLDLDDIDDETLLAASLASQSSSVGPAALKRNTFVSATQPTLPTFFQSPWSSSPSTFALPSASGPPSPSLPAAVDDPSLPWFERFAPRSLDELAVHKRKVADVRGWLESVFDGRLRQRLLILRGPSGTGKTTTLRLLAAALHCEVLEWKNPTEQYAPGQPSYTQHLEQFLGVGRTFGSLDTELGDSSGDAPSALLNASPTMSAEHRLLLLEEFPSSLSRSSPQLLAFRRALLDYLAAASSPIPRNSSIATPIVMIISETLLTTSSATADSFTAHRLLGPEILRHPATGMIDFNPIAPSLLQKALETVVAKAARPPLDRKTKTTRPSTPVLRSLSAMGDIRSALSALEFYCLRDSAGGALSDKKVKGRTAKGRTAKGAAAKEKTKDVVDASDPIHGRESSLGIFHAVGKVVYNKREPVEAMTQRQAVLPDSASGKPPPPPSVVRVDRLVEETGTDISTFLSALHENFPLSCTLPPPPPPPTTSEGDEDVDRPTVARTSVDHLVDCLRDLSDADYLAPAYDSFFASYGRFGGSGTGPSMASSASASSSGGGGQDTSSHLFRQDELAFHVAVRGLLYHLPYPVQRPARGRGGPHHHDAHKMYYPSSIKLWRTKEEAESTLESLARQTLHSGMQPLTDDMAMVSGAMDSVADPSQAKSLPSESSTSTDAHSAAGEPMRLCSLGCVSRPEFLLERLPYMNLIQPGQAVDLEEAATFSTLLVVRGRAHRRPTTRRRLGGHAGDDDEELAMEDVQDTAVAEQTGLLRAIRKAKTPRPPQQQQQPHQQQIVGGPWTRGATAATRLDRLVLSDDDIED